MHYKNGRPATIGDKVLVNSFHGPFIGVVIGAQPGTETCNLHVVPLPAAFQHATAKECLHIEDIKEQAPEQK